MHRRNLSFLIAAVTVLAYLTSCTKTPVDNTVRTVSFLMDPCHIWEENGSDAITKTSIVDGSTAFRWAQGDTVGIYPDAGAQIYFTLNVEGDGKSAQFDGGGWEFKSGSTYYSYYPFVGDIYLKRNRIPVSYLGQKQVGTTNFSHVGPFDYMYTEGVSAVSGGLNFQYHRLGCFIRLRCVLPGGTYTKLAITAPEQLFTAKGYFDLTSSSPAIVATEYTNQLTIDLASVTTTGTSAEFVVYLLSAPVDLSGKEITISVLNDQKKEYQCKKTPSAAYVANDLRKLGCTSFTEVPQSMGLIVEDWGNGGSIGGNAD